MRFSTTTPTETSFFRAAFLFLEAVRMFEDVFGICQQDADGQRLFLFGSEFKQVEFTQHCGEKFEENVYLLCMPLLPLQQHGGAETG